MSTYTMVANGYTYYAGPPPPRWYKFTGDSAQPFGILQVIEGTGTSRVDPSRRIAIKYMPARTAATTGTCDDFQDLYESVTAGGTLVFTIVCDANNYITGFSWRRYTGTRQLSSDEVLLAEASEKLDRIDTYVRQAVPPNLGEQISELRSLIQIVVDRNALGSGYPGPIEDAEEEELLKSG
jgi:hypothetical protein